MRSSILACRRRKPIMLLTFKQSQKIARFPVNFELIVNVLYQVLFFLGGGNLSLSIHRFIFYDFFYKFQAQDG